MRRLIIICKSFGLCNNIIESCTTGVLRTQDLLNFQNCLEYRVMRFYVISRDFHSCLKYTVLDMSNTENSTTKNQW